MIFRKTKQHEDAFLEQAIRGERAGLEYLVGAYKDLAYTVAFRIVMNKEDAEEVVQDSFLRAFASLENLKGLPNSQPGCSASFTIPRLQKSKTKKYSYQNLVTRWTIMRLTYQTTPSTIC